MKEPDELLVHLQTHETWRLLFKYMETERDQRKKQTEERTSILHPLHHFINCVSIPTLSKDMMWINVIKSEAEDITHIFDTRMEMKKEEKNNSFACNLKGYNFIFDRTMAWSHEHKREYVNDIVQNTDKWIFTMKKYVYFCTGSTSIRWSTCIVAGISDISPLNQKVRRCPFA